MRVLIFFDSEWWGCSHEGWMLQGGRLDVLFAVVAR